MIENTVLLATALLAAAWLFRPALRRSTNWIATVTPLASIIGSGFLVVAPLLAHAVDGWALAAMAAIVIFAYAIGAVIRFNIRHAEPLLGADGTPQLLLGVERFSDLALGSAYLISVAFYVRLLASFVLRAADTRNDLYANLLTTGVLLFIGVTGLRRGLGGLERLEEYAVNLKLAIIVALLPLSGTRRHCRRLVREHFRNHRARFARFCLLLLPAMPGRSCRQHQSRPPEKQPSVAYLSRAHGLGAVAGGAVRDS